MGFLGQSPSFSSHGPKGIDWSTAPLGKVPDSEVARALGVSTACVCARRKKLGIKALLPARSPFAKGIDWPSVPLGEERDDVLATRIGVATTTVARERKKRGIAPPVRGKFLRQDIDWRALPRLGLVADAVIAAELGVHKAAVGTARRRIGVPSARERGLFKGRFMGPARIMGSRASSSAAE